MAAHATINAAAWVNVVWVFRFEFICLLHETQRERVDPASSILRLIDSCAVTVGIQGRGRIRQIANF